MMRCDCFFLAGYHKMSDSSMSPSGAVTGGNDWYYYAGILRCTMDGGSKRTKTSTSYPLKKYRKIIGKP